MVKRVRAVTRWVTRYSYPLFAPFVALGLVSLFSHLKLAQSLEDQSVNARFRVRAPWDPPPDPRLIFVGIDQLTLEKFGAWPWPRTCIADNLKMIVNAGANPRVVAFDVLFTTNSTICIQPRREQILMKRWPNPPPTCRV